MRKRDVGAFYTQRERSKSCSVIERLTTRAFPSPSGAACLYYEIAKNLSSVGATCELDVPPRWGFVLCGSATINMTLLAELCARCSRKAENPRIQRQRGRDESLANLFA